MNHDHYVLRRCCIHFYHIYIFVLVWRVQFLFSVSKATETYQRLVEQGFPHLINFLKNVGGFRNEIAALEVIRSKANLIIEKLLQPIEPMGLITHTDFWCNNLVFKETNKPNENDTAEHKIIECIILDWQMISYSRYGIFKFSFTQNI